ncbi:Hypothetical predicted protein [Mytilus galloprovincialis]|uniref:Uncharacterized protein n=1 Tax=Mytilus galloprovincialis TaxID=29158 RepID=A0A8B6F7V2_MYTGA|nr:Hypothetical predicted protein [Mytilus galloprovincialis]
MPSIFVLKLEETSAISSFDGHIHQYDNGWLLCFDSWGEFTIEKLLLEEARVFFQEFNTGSCRLDTPCDFRKKKKTVEQTIKESSGGIQSDRIVWSKLPQTPILWPVRVVNQEHLETEIYCYSDNAYHRQSNNKAKDQFCSSDCSYLKSSSLSISSSESLSQYLLSPSKDSIPD